MGGDPQSPKLGETRVAGIELEAGGDQVEGAFGSRRHVLEHEVDAVSPGSAR